MVYLREFIPPGEEDEEPGKPYTFVGDYEHIFYPSTYSRRGTTKGLNTCGDHWFRADPSWADKDGNIYSKPLEEGTINVMHVDKPWSEIRKLQDARYHDAGKAGHLWADEQDQFDSDPNRSLSSRYTRRDLSDD